jgi:hypothetical protein
MYQSGYSFIIHNWIVLKDRPSRWWQLLWSEVINDLDIQGQIDNFCDVTDSPFPSQEPVAVLIWTWNIHAISHRNIYL